MPVGAGPLAGLRVIEFQSAGPGPFACMLLGDLGADVVTVERPPAEARNPLTSQRAFDPTSRNRRSIALDLKKPGAVEVALQLIESADVMTEGLRPGVMERLGLGPDVALTANPRLIYARMTGWGQDGPLAQVAGHDINYIALTGALAAIGPASGQPLPPLNLVGDYGGGGMLLVFGILAALYERANSGSGQVVDAAMVDGASLLMSIFHGTLASGGWISERGSNLLDGGAPFYRTYLTADGKYLAVGAIERKFYANLITGLGLASEIKVAEQHDREAWPTTAAAIARRFATKTQSQWVQQFEGIDACLAPVLSMTEAYGHAHAHARSAFFERDGGRQPSPAPRFSRSKPEHPRPARTAGEDTEAILTELGYGPEEIQRLRNENAALDPTEGPQTINPTEQEATVRP